MKIQLSGPITGIAHDNRPAFAHAEGLLMDLGHSVWNPTHEIPPTASYREAMRCCLEWLCTEAEGIVSLPVWTLSPGAKAEAATAWALRLPHWELRGEQFLPYPAAANPAKGPLLRVTGQSGVI